jgi:hypothetical protein
MTTTIEIDESAYGALIIGGAFGYLYHQADPAIRALLADVALGAGVFLALGMMATFVMMMTEMLLWDWVWDQVRGGAEK